MIVHILTVLIAIGLIITGGLFVVCGGLQDATTLLGSILAIIIGIALFIFLGRSLFRAGKLSTRAKLSKESIELIEDLDHIDISRIESVQFIPTGEDGFVIETENIKRLAKYITDKLGKSEFAPNELRGAYTHVQKYLVSHEPTGVVLEHTALIDNFVAKGGHVNIQLVS